jgi:toxin YoeB
MGKYKIQLTESAKEDLEKLKKIGNKSVLNKIDKIYKELKEHP